MSQYVLGLRKIDSSGFSLAGGKGANLGELSSIEGIQVPDGFCVTTEAYKRVTQNNEELKSLLGELTQLKAADREKIGQAGAKIRQVIEGITIPREIADEIGSYLAKFDKNVAFAVRSSATAEDLPTASFAGQQDTYLNIMGHEAILAYISKCWASLFTDRAITYRLQNGFDHRKVYLAVVVQQMVLPQASGILFTADPATSNRKVLSIDASFGLGEALVSGLVNPDNYKVKNGEIISKQISTKELAIVALNEGGTKQLEIGPDKQKRQVLTDECIFELAHTGRKIEKHFGSPQDIEWCLDHDKFYVVQSRPITTLFPIPVTDDDENHVYVSVGHQQMMTDALKPLGLSVWMLTGGRPIFKTGGGRLFVDIATGLASPAGRQNLLDVLGHSDPLIKDALITVIERGNFIKSDPNDKSEPGPIKSHKGMSAADILTEAGSDPAIVAGLIESSRIVLSALKDSIQTKSGPEVFDCILEDMQQRRQHAADTKNLSVIMAAIHASAWLNEKMDEWLGEKNVADTLTLSAPNNITSEMGMQLLDVADVIRPYPEIVEYLQKVKDDNFLDELVRFEGGQMVRDAVVEFLDKYGMRCAGEIDITRTRWSEKPATLIPMILGNINNLEPGASKQKFEQGQKEALKKELELLERLKHLPDGKEKALEAKQMMALVRNFIGYREYPKYGIVSRYWIYKQALVKESEKLIRAGLIREKEDVYYLTFEEFREVVATSQLDYQLIIERKEKQKIYEKLTPPRVMTSDGEIVTGRYNRADLPAGAIVGLAVSSGIAEGRARVILNIEDANLEPDDILVTSFTDPSWTPLFVGIKGLVTEVGGLMTHGAVIAREYGLSAVVGVENATKLIEDGQRIRVNGTNGYVELL